MITWHNYGHVGRKSLLAQVQVQVQVQVQAQLTYS